MKALTKKAFEILADIQHADCVSIYLPTHKGGVEVINEQDSLLFKNQLKTVGQKLTDRGWTASKIEEFLGPPKDLLDNSKFWRNQDEGLAIFLTPGTVRYFNLPFKVAPYVHIDQRFYLRPIVPLFSGEGNFYVLALNLHRITFFEGNREKLKAIDIDVPQQLEEVVGYDYEEKFLQFRSQQEGHGQAAFHGHGEWKGEFKKDEIQKFFRVINNEVTKVIGDKNIPLVLIGQEYFYGIYKKVNSYPHFLEEYIDLNPEYMDIKDLHHKIWEKLYARFDEDRIKKMELLKQLHNTPRTSFDVAEIIPAAINGRIDTLFVQREAEIWGYFNKTENSVLLEEKQTISNTSLLNQAVVEVLRKGGKVYEQIAETMPVPFVELNALYRF